MGEQDQLHGISEMRNDYFDTMRALVAENQSLRAELEKEQERLNEVQAIASADARGIEQYEKDVKNAIAELTAERARQRAEEQTELAWLAGRADSVAKTLKKDNRCPQA